jgi:hypothetical protein
MNRRTQRNGSALIVPMKRLLAVAAAVCLLATLANRAISLPVQAASAAKSPAPTSPSPTPTTATGWLRPSATPERATASPAEQVQATATPAPASTPATVGCTDSVQFLDDVTVPDGTVLGPNERFVKTWRVRSAGSCDWAGYRVVLVGGEPMAGLDHPIPDTPAGQEVEISIEMTSPDGPGDYKSYWQVQSPDGANLGTLTCVIVVDDGDGEPATEQPREAPTPIPAPASPSDVNEERWIDIGLSQQSLTAYEGRTPVHTTLVSTGLPGTPTPVGQFRIWIKFRSDDMAGPGYYIEDVPYVMYFYKGYGLHGVTWHGNFGHPMSHGCVNLPTAEAEWLFNWADVGTLVNIHD